MRSRPRLALWLLSAVLSFAPHSRSLARELLSNPALFMRCYAQLTQSRVPADDPLLLQVVAGTKGPVAACMEVFDKGRFNTAGRVAATNAVGKQVLHTFHKLHASWFQEREFTGVGLDQPTSVGDIYDVDTPALYFTRAMFQPGVPFRFVVQGTKHLRALRTDNDPPLGANSNREKSLYVFDGGFRFAGKGELLGIQETGNLPTAYSYTVGGTTKSGVAEIGKHFGGGLLGSTPYLLLNVNESRDFKSNGGEAMPRKWARAVFSDLLCRDLPVVRYADVPSFRVAASPVPFRKTQGCVQCHASMDRMASAIRGFGFVNIGNLVAGMPGGGFPAFAAPTAGTGVEWPSSPQANYNLKEPDGVFYFRNYKGALRNAPFRGVTALGNVLAAEEDLFVCAAKRYYSYFMGVDVSLGDTQGASALTPKEAAQKKNVVDLAQALKADSDQSLRDMVQKLLELPAYRNSDFSP